MFETQYEALRRQGVSRRSFLQFCSLTAASLGLGSAGAQEIAQAIETKPRMPVVWLHGLECTCCTESFIRSYHPVAKDLVLSMISLDYDDTIMAAAGHQAEAALEETITKYKGNYILAVEGNVPLNDDGVNCIPAGETFLQKIKHVAAGAKAVIGWGSCAAWGCVQAAKPNPTHSVPITEIITDKPIVLVPGCPPIPEVMTAVVTYILLTIAFRRLIGWDGRRCSTVSVFMINAIVGRISMPVSSLRNLMTKAPNWAIASIRSGVKDRPHTMLVQRFVGMRD